MNEEIMRRSTIHTLLLPMLLWSLLYLLTACSSSPNTLLTYSSHSNDGISSAIWSPTGNSIASRVGDHTVQAWDATTGKSLITYTVQNDVTRVEWSPDGKFIAIAENGVSSTIWVLDATNGRQSSVLKGVHGSFSWSPDSTRIAAIQDEQTITLFDIATGKVSLTLHSDTPAYRNTPFFDDLAWSPDSTRLASLEYLNADRMVQLWDVSRGRLLLRHAGSTVAWSPDSTRLYSFISTHIQAWDSTTGNDLLTIPLQIFNATPPQLSPNGKFITGETANNKFTVCDTATGKCVFTSQTDSDPGTVSLLKWSPDGLRIGTASLPPHFPISGGSNAVQVWDATNGNLIEVYSGNSSTVEDVSWSPDSKFIVSTSGGTAQVWQP